MPTLEAEVFDYLSTDPGIGDLVGDRIYPVKSPERAVLPYIRWNRVDAQREYTYDSYEDTAAWVRARVQFDCFSTTAQEAMLIGEAVLLALSGHGATFAIRESDDYEKDTKLFKRSVDFRFLYQDDLSVSS